VDVKKCPSADKPLKNFRTKILNLLMTQTNRRNIMNKKDIVNEAGSGQPILRVCQNLPRGNVKNQKAFRWDNQCLSQDSTRNSQNKKQ